MVKYVLFGAAIIFAALFVMSTLYGFVWQMTDVMQGVHQNANIVMWTYIAFCGGLIGWILSTFALVLVDELDGVDVDDELSVTE